MPSSVVLITGAPAGIGRQTALAFDRTGARVVVSGRRPGAGEALAAELAALGAESLFVAADVRREDDVMEAQGAGSIVNLSSTMEHRGAAGLALYAAAFVAGLPLKRAGRPDEIADAILYLASDHASFITGQIIDVNGGKTAS